MAAQDPIIAAPVTASTASSRKNKSNKSWRSRLSLRTSTDIGSSRRRPPHSHDPHQTDSGVHPQTSHHDMQDETSGSTSRTASRTQGKNTYGEKWWQIYWFQGMWNDVKRRAPYYRSDWTDAWDYRVVPATIYMYFANILPALAFSLDMFTKTNMSFGVNEVLLASVLGAVVFSLFAAQPLVIVGVTGPITVFNYTVYDIITPRGTDYFAFMCWIGIWSLILHWILAITNSCNGLRYVTRFSCDIFGFYVALIYLQKGIQVLTRQWEISDASAYLQIMVSLLVLMVAYICGYVGESTLFQRWLRKFIEDYGTPLTVIFFTGFVYIGKMRDVELETLPTTKAFFPTIDRGWLVHFWNLPVGDIFLALPFAILLTILFWFDHNVSSLIAQGTEFPLRKPAGFHWDIFLLGLTTGVAGLLGIPFPNGLIPQAPFHTTALCVTKTVAKTAATNGTEKSNEDDPSSSNPHETVRIVDHVVEQRVSNLAQGLLTLGTMTGPLLIVLSLIPQGVMAGLFFVMGVQALQANGMTSKLLFLVRDKNLTPASDPLLGIKRRWVIWAFVGLELFGFAATFAITQTIAAIGFPVVILALIPARTWLLPRFFTRKELAILDAPTASPFTMESVGGVHGHHHEGGNRSDGDDIDAFDAVAAGSDDDELAGGAATSSGNNSGAATSKDSGTPAEEDTDADEVEKGISKRFHDPQEGSTGAKRRTSFRASDEAGAADRIEMMRSGR